MAIHYIETGDPEWMAMSNLDWPLTLGHQVREIVADLEGVGYVAGGAARFFLVSHSPHPLDIDVFLFDDKHESAAYTALAALGYIEDGGPARAPRFLHEDYEIPVQLVIPDDVDHRLSFGPPLQVLKEFTFYVEQAAIYAGGDGIVGLVSESCRRDVRNKTLHFNNLSNPLLAAYRLNKYGKKGFTVGMEDILKLGKAFRKGTVKDFELIIVDALGMQS